MDQIPLGWPLPKRRVHLSELESKPSSYTNKIWFQNHETLLRVFRIQIDLPKYRLANGRTQEAQEEYLATHKELGDDFFTRDSESGEAQQVQHSLLKELIKDPNPDIDLIKYFSKNKQDEPLILSNEGYVVNGNRRLCAFRDLYYSDKVKYAHFSHLDMMVLPPCDFKDIDELEAKLQIQPDIKQPYTWISRAIMLKKRQEQHHYSYETLAGLYAMDSKDVSESLDLLGAVDEYLTNRGKEKQYRLVHNKEYAFKQIQKARKKLKKPDEKDLLCKICYGIIESGDIDRRLYEVIPEVSDYFPKIIGSLSRELKIDTVIDTPPTIPSPQFQLFGNGDNKLAKIIKVVDDPKNIQHAVDIVIEVIEQEKAKLKEKRRADSVFQEVSKANAALISAINCITDDSEISGVKEQLESIDQSVQKIRLWLYGHDKNSLK